MAGRYGMSFAKKHLEDGDYEEAVEAATQAIEGGDGSPEHLFDRAQAYELLERFDEAAADFEAAIAKNNTEKVLDPFVIDDAYFSALVAGAQSLAGEGKKDAAASLLGRYAKTLPSGGHVVDARDWQMRVRGQLPSLLDKTKPLDQA